MLCIHLHVYCHDWIHTWYRKASSKIYENLYQRWYSAYCPSAWLIEFRKSWSPTMLNLPTYHQHWLSPLSMRLRINFFPFLLQALRSSLFDWHNPNWAKIKTEPDAALSLILYCLATDQSFLSRGWQVQTD